MGSRGPSPTPTRILRLRGTWRADRHTREGAEPQFEPMTHLPPAPPFFDDVARFEWHRVGPELIEQRLLTHADLAAFTLYCVHVARVVACERILREKGMTCRGPRGERARPEVAIARQAGAEVRKFAQELGLTPSARRRVTPAPRPREPKPSNPFDDI